MQSVSVSSANGNPAPKAKRQKHVFDTGEIPHLWAHQTQSEARNANKKLYFEGPTIYSYGSHFPIARIVTRGLQSWQSADYKTGKRKPVQCVLFTTRTYSVTTAGHVSAVRGAIPPDMPVFHVHSPEAAADTGCKRDYEKRIAELAQLTKEKGMRENTRANRVEIARGVIAEYKAFCKFFHLKTSKLPTLAKIDAEKLRLALKSIAGRRASIERKREEEREARKAEAIAEAERWNASGYCTHTPRHDAQKRGEGSSWYRSERSICEDLTESAKRAEKQKEYLSAWLRGEDTGYMSLYDVPVQLRIVGDEIETTKGARFPVSHAKRGLALVRAVMSRGEEWHTNGHTCHLGHYSLDRITPDGTVYAGCHVVPFASIERIASAVDAYVVPASQASAE